MVQSYNFFYYYNHPDYGFYYPNRRFMTFNRQNDSNVPML